MPVFSTAYNVLHSLPLAHKHTFLVSPFPSPSFLKPPPAVHGLLAVPLRGIPWRCIYCFHRLECSNNPRYIHGWPSYLLLVFAQIHLLTKALSPYLKQQLCLPCNSLLPCPPTLAFSPLYLPLPDVLFISWFYFPPLGCTSMKARSLICSSVHSQCSEQYLAHSRPSIDVCGISEYNAVL